MPKDQDRYTDLLKKAGTSGPIRLGVELRFGNRILHANKEAAIMAALPLLSVIILNHEISLAS